MQLNHYTESNGGWILAIALVWLVTLVILPELNIEKEEKLQRKLSTVSVVADKNKDTKTCAK